MKKTNKKFLTFMLAGALCAATIGGAVSLNTVKSSAAAATGEYKLSDVFVTEKAIVACDDANVTTFTLSDKAVVKFTRDLAFKWFEGEGVNKYLTLNFAFQDLNFKKVEFVVESNSAWASEADKATNTIAFVNNSGNVSVSVNGGSEVATVITAGSNVQLSLASATEDGEFDVLMKVADGEASKVGKFVNIGSNFSSYNYSTMIPFAIKAEMPEVAEGEEAKNSVIALKEINGQSFENIKKDGNDYLVKDNAAPVLVVNEEIGGFLLGTKFSLNYEKVDVLQDSNLTETMEYYQWSPADETATYKETTSSFFFNDLVYEKEDGSKTTVFMEEGKEYVSLKITLGDKVFKDAEGETAKKTYELTWYADEASVASKGEVKYIVMDRNTEGAVYSNVVANAETKKNDIVNEETYAEKIAAFQKVLEKTATTTYVGQKINVPSVKWLVEDNNGFRNLNFIISYKKLDTDTATATNSLAYNKLQFEVASEGEYEFKIFAKDKADNEMQYYLDGELTAVTADTVWEIEEIPSFKFEITNKGIVVDYASYLSDSQRKAEEDVGDKYTLSDIKVFGAKTVGEKYKLFKLNEDKANAIKLTADDLYKVAFKDLETAVKAEIKELKDDYFDIYLKAYAKLLAQKLSGGLSADSVYDCFEVINEFDDAIDEETHKDLWKKHNQYNWTAASQSFTVAEAGSYLILADYYMQELPMERTVAYKVINAESEANIREGETESWFETNIVSVILFAIAGVLLIIIIILLFVKPSDETLEDIDAKAKKKAEKESKSKKD